MQLANAAFPRLDLNQQRMLNVTFDRSPEGDVTLVLNFSRTSTMTAKLATTVYRRAATIAHGLRRGPGAGVIGSLRIYGATVQ